MRILSRRPRSALVAIAFPVLFTGALPALASTDHYLEVQLSSAELADQLRRQLSTQSDFCPAPVACPNSPGQSCYVDHLELGPVGTFSRAAAQSGVAINAFTTLQSLEVFYTQPVNIHLKTAACVGTVGCTTTTQVAGTMRYRLSAGAGGAVCAHKAGSTGFPAGSDAPGIAFCLAISADVMSAMTGGISGAVSGAALSLAADGSRVATRVEFGRSAAEYGAIRIAAWHAFLSGVLETTGASGDWSVFAHRTLIEATARAQIRDALEAVPGFDVDGAISTSWMGLGTAGGKLTASLAGTVTDSPCPNDIGVSNMSLDLLSSINDADDGLSIDGDFQYSLNGGDVALCGFLLGGPVGALVFNAIADVAGVDFELLGDECAADGDLSFACDVKTHPHVMSLAPGQSTSFSLSSVIGASTGLAMNGAVQTLGSASLTSQIDVATPSFGLQGSCRGAKVGQYTGGLRVGGTARLCGVTFSNDPLDMFDVVAPPDLSLPAQFEVIVAPSSLANKQAYEAAPYGLRATVATAAGISTHQFGAVDLKPDLEMNELTEAMIVLAKADCLKVKEWPWERYFWGWYPEWPFDELRDIPARVLDDRGGLLDYGMLTDVRIEVVRDRLGDVASMTVHADAHIGDGRGGVGTQALALAVAVPPGTRGASDREVVQLLLPSGLTARPGVDRLVAPAAPAGAAIDVALSLPQLEAGAR